MSSTMPPRSKTSPDGRYTAFTEHDRISEYVVNEKIYVADNQTGTTNLIYDYMGHGDFTGAFIGFSADSRYLVYQTMATHMNNIQRKPYHYYIYDTTSETSTSITDQSYRILDAGLSDDGIKFTWTEKDWRGKTAEKVFYIPSIAQFTIPTIASDKLDQNGNGNLTTGDVLTISIGLVGVVSQQDQSAITIRLNNGGIATYDQDASIPGETYVFRYKVRLEDHTRDLSVASIEMNGAMLLGQNGSKFVLAGDLARGWPGTLTIDGYTGTNASEDFRGTAGAEPFDGRGGDDTFLVDNAKDKVIEAVGGGKDTVVATLSYALNAGQEIEVLRVSPDVTSAAVNLTGNEFAQTVEGNAGRNVLDGRGGADTMAGRAGDDTYVVDNAGDIVLEAKGAGTDRVLTSVSYGLGQGQEIEELSAADAASTAPLRLAGNSFAQTIAGNAGDNELVGKGGGDKLVGRGGNDTYFVRDQTDRVFEAEGGGFDTLRTSRSYALAAGQEVEFLGFTDDGSTDGLSLTGNAFGQSLRGNNGDNRLDGGGGADTLVGRGGNDTYLVDDAGDVVLEGRGAGNDTVLATVSHALKAGQAIEALEALSETGTASLNFTGNEIGQSLKGNAGSNILDGKGGVDVMAGLAGNDTYAVDDVRDAVIESKGQGADAVIASVSYTLAAGQEIETLRLAATVGERSLDLTGNAFGQTLVGSDGANVLDGREGADVLTGGKGLDAFVFATKPGTGNVDRITDFAPVDDTIRLAGDVFTALDAGPLAAGAFKEIGKAGRDADDRILYDSRNGKLFYDADGSGKAAAVQFAVLDNKAKLTADDFFVI